MNATQSLLVRLRLMVLLLRRRLMLVKAILSGRRLLIQTETKSGTLSTGAIALPQRQAGIQAEQQPMLLTHGPAQASIQYA